MSGTARTTLSALLALLCSLAGTAWAQDESAGNSAEASTASAGDEDPDNLEVRGATIRAVDIRIDNVFDTSNQGEDKRLYRVANRIHRRTRQHVIENILLFESDQILDARLLAETERLLRAQRFIADASIVAGDYDATTNSTAVDVHVRDSWSLEPDMKWSRGGGANEYAIGATEDNLFGLGKSMTVAFESDVDRDQRIFLFTDPNLRGSRVRMEIDLADQTDGKRIGFHAGRPFYSLDSRWSISATTLDNERVEPKYDLGEIIDRYRHDTRRFDLQGGYSRGLVDGVTRRWIAGLTSEEDLFQGAEGRDAPLLVPVDRKLVYPWVGVQIVEDDFRQVTELNDIGRTEDVALGLNLTATVGFASTGLGSDRDATVLDLNASKGWEPGGPGSLFMMRASATAREEDIGVRNSIVEVAGQYYRRNFQKGLLSVSMRAVLANKLDFENQVLLGGDSGLRGYPLRYQAGERSTIFSAEQRFFTNWYPFRLIRVGYAFFMDAGRVWGDDSRSVSDLGTLYDVGVGLRLTSPRSSSHSVIHIDLAFPVNAPADIDNVQLNLERKLSF